MGTRCETVFMTGTTGLVGSEVLRRMLTLDPTLRVVVLVRNLARWNALATDAALPAERVTPVVGDIKKPGLDLDEDVRSFLARHVTIVVHVAADTVFSRPLEMARATNLEGTRHVLEMAEAWPQVWRVLYVSTAFVAGRRVGCILERDNGSGLGWVNAYEQSKYEAEQLVRATRRGWLILRPSTIICDSRAGTVRQFNAVHHALRLLYLGLAPMLPGTGTSTVDVVPGDYVAAAIASLTLRERLWGQTFHLCAGSGAITLDELLDSTWDVWSKVPAWRRKAISRPVLANITTYRLFEQTVKETGDRQLKRAVRSLSSFAPQLALPKRFDTAQTEATLGQPAAAVTTYWPRMIEHLVTNRWTKTLPGGAA